MLMEVCVNGYSHIMTDTHNGTKGIGTHTQVSHLTQELHGMSLFLQRICIVGNAEHFNFTCLNLNCLT